MNVSENSWNEEEEEEAERPTKKGKDKKGNVLPVWGSDRTMNMNPLILTNIQSSHYFKGVLVTFFMSSIIFLCCHWNLSLLGDLGLSTKDNFTMFFFSFLIFSKFVRA